MNEIEIQIQPDEELIVEIQTVNTTATDSPQELPDLLTIYKQAKGA